MASRLLALTFLALDPDGLADFWAGLLGWERVDDPLGAGAPAIAPPPGWLGGFPVRFERTDVPKTLQNVMHFDLNPGTDEGQAELVARALSLGGSHIDVGQLPEERHVPLGDPEGNEMCAVEAGNGFLAGCGLTGCLSSDGSHAVGVFWSEALGWPLVWDEGEETAIQAPEGGTKISWGGPPYMEKPTPARQRLELAADDVDAEVSRLIGLGATRLPGPGVLLADPDGGAFGVYPS